MRRSTWSRRMVSCEMRSTALSKSSDSPLPDSPKMNRIILSPVGLMVCLLKIPPSHQGTLLCLLLFLILLVYHVSVLHGLSRTLLFHSIYRCLQSSLWFTSYEEIQYRWQFSCSKKHGRTHSNRFVKKLRFNKDLGRNWINK